MPVSSADLAISPNGQTLYAVQVFGAAVSAIDLQRRKEIKKVSLAAEPYTALMSADGRTLFVSLWGGGKVLMFAAETLEPHGRGRRRRASQRDGPVEGWHAACSSRAPTRTRCGSSTSQSQSRDGTDLASRCYPNAPVGTTPNSLALSPDGATLLVANADNNTVAVVDVSDAGREPGPRMGPGRLVSDVGVMFDRDGSSDSSC